MKRALLLIAAALVVACASPVGPTAPPGPRRSPIVMPAAPTPKPAPSMIPPALPPAPAEDPAPPPDGECPPETLRGWAFYAAAWPGGSCIGDAACSRVNASGGFPANAEIAFDSTAHPKPGQPIPPGCKVPPTSWTIAPAIPFRTQGNEPFAMQATFAAAGRYMLTSHGPEGVKAESGVVVIR